MSGTVTSTGDIVINCISSCINPNGRDSDDNNSKKQIYVCWVVVCAVEKNKIKLDNGVIEYWM